MRQREAPVRPFYVRELTRYPVGARRLRYLLMAVLASLILNFEGQIAPVLPLILDDLHMSLSTYGLIGAVAVLAGAVSAAVGGRFADRWGRTVLLVPTLFVTALCDFATTLVQTPAQLLVVRAVLLFVEGAAVTTTAGLVRDFSPRLGRATAFAFWTWGPVGANFLAAGIAGWTLSYFTTWRSQFVIIGTVALLCSVAIAVFVADLAPGLRARVISTEADLATASAGDEPVHVGQVRQLFRHRQVWAHLGGITLWQAFYWTMQIFGPTILVQTFGFGERQAASVTAAGWAVNLLALFAAGWLSDRLQARKPLILAGSVCGLVAMGYLAWLVRSGHASPLHVLVVNALLGTALAVAFAPWMALYSEDVEDIRPELQATAWGLFGLAVRFMIVALLVLAPTVTDAAGTWFPWLLVAMVCNAALVPAVFLFGGSWSRAPATHRPVPAVPA
jgi:OPA family glycerol-3-phosphate transporter-like MFS transporter